MTGLPSACIAAFLAFSGLTAPAFGATQAESGGNSQRAPETPQRTADEILAALRRARPLPEVVPPAGGTFGTPVVPPRPLYPEGAVVADWVGNLRRDGDGWVFIAQTPDGQPPTRMLPNLNLEIMTRTAAGRHDPVRFLISGEMTVFQGENFLLARYLRRVEPPVDRPQGEPAAPDSREAVDTDDAPAADPSAAEIVNLLRGQKPQAALTDDAAARRLRSLGGPLGPTVKPDGTPFPQRPGRLTRDGGDWMFTFETEHPGAEAPMVTLLPGRGLESMIQWAQETPEGLVLLVTGEVTQFYGQNFLLPRGVTRRAARDNLRK